MVGVNNVETLNKTIVRNHIAITHAVVEFCTILILLVSCATPSTRENPLPAHLARYYETDALHTFAALKLARKYDSNRPIRSSVHVKPTLAVQVSIPTVDSLDQKGNVIISYEPQSLSRTSANVGLDVTWARSSIQLSEKPALVYQTH